MILFLGTNVLECFFSVCLTRGLKGPAMGAICVSLTFPSARLLGRYTHGGLGGTY